MNKTIIISLSLFLAACAAPNIDQSAAGFNEDKYRDDLANCRGGNIVEASAKTFGVALLGSAIGAANGASAGLIHGKADIGAIVGAAVGGTVGLGVGASEAVKRHEGEIAVCLRGKGYVVAG